MARRGGRVAGVIAAVTIAAVTSVGCEHRPPPEGGSRPGGAGSAVPVTPPADAAPAPPDVAAAGAGSGSGLAQAQANAAQFKACTEAATHAIDVSIALSPPENRAQLTTERPKLIEQMRDPCVMQGWSTEAVTCVREAKDFAALQRCQPLIRPPAPAPTAGSGSGGAP